MDAQVQEAKRVFATTPTFENERKLEDAYRRAGYRLAYVACKRCNPETRCVRSHGRAVLCGECGGQGWTDTKWEAP